MIKRKNPLLCALLALCLLCLAYAGVTVYQKYADRRREAAADAAAIHINQMGDIVSISFQNGEEPPLSFTKEDGVWQYADDSSFPLEQSHLNGIEEKGGNLTAVRKLTDGDSLADYGLEEPAKRLILKNQSGVTAELSIGNRLENGDYYAKKNRDPAVYTIDAALPDALSLSLNEMAIVDQFPDVRAEDIKEIQITGPQTELRLGREELGKAEETGAAEATGTAEAAESPYQKLKSALAAMRTDSCYLWKATPQDLSVCGLSVPEAVISYYYENEKGSSQVVLHVGAKDESGEYYYVKFSDSDMMCKMRVEKVERVMEEC